MKTNETTSNKKDDVNFVNRNEVNPPNHELKSTKHREKKHKGDEVETVTVSSVHDNKIKHTVPVVEGMGPPTVVVKDDDQFLAGRVEDVPGVINGVTLPATPIVDNNFTGAFKSS